MTEVGEKINTEAICKRGFDVQELADALRKNAFWTVGSWGAHAWTRHDNKWLRFMVNGMKHKGHVYITLDWNDTFILYFTTSRGKIVAKMEDIYIDMLVPTIDKFVERD